MASARTLATGVLGQVLPDSVLGSFQEKVFDPNEVMSDLRLPPEFRRPLEPMLARRHLTISDVTVKHPYSGVEHQVTRVDGLDPPLYLLHVDFRVVDQPTQANVDSMERLTRLSLGGSRLRIFTGSDSQPHLSFERMVASWVKEDLDATFVQLRHFREIDEDNDQELWDVLRVPIPGPGLAGPGVAPAATAQVAPAAAGGHKVFVSYAHADDEVFQRVKVHLQGLVHSAADVDIWTDERIDAGDRWRDEIADALRLATCAVLLVSADFLASAFVRVHELPQLLKAAEGDHLRVFWMKAESGVVPDKIKQYQALHIDPPLGTLERDPLEAALEKAMETLVGYLGP